MSDVSSLENEPAWVEMRWVFDDHPHGGLPLRFASLQAAQDHVNAQLPDDLVIHVVVSSLF